MITAHTLQTLISQTPAGLSDVLARCGRRGQSFVSAEFLGMTNGGEFAYRVVGADQAQGKVFVKYNTQTGQITASC